MKLSESEWQIMNALWREHPATAREVRERLPDNVEWAYTTIKTMLTRLVAKDAVAEEKRGNTSVYEPLVTRQKARSNALKSLLNQAFDGAVGPLLSFIAEDKKLSKKQKMELAKLLELEDKRGGKEK